ncbi:MAG: A kinase anchor 9, partial [Trebouxia sp. A1-2]
DLRLIDIDMAVRGYLTIVVTQASSRTKANDVVWDSTFAEGFVKVEVRGGPRNNKVVSSTKKVSDGLLEWNETLKLEVLEESRELRIVLCRPKTSGSRTGSAVVAACGIFVDDILDAVPIDKWFEMFKPGAAGEGGFIRVHMSFSEGDPSESRDPSPTETMAPTENGNSVETRPGIAESFAPALSGFTSEMHSDVQSAQKENRPPGSQGSQNMPSPSTSLQQKTDEAESRETSPDYSEAEAEVHGADSEVIRAESEGLADRIVEIEPEIGTNAQEVQEIHYEREPDLPKQSTQYRREVASPKKHKKKSGGKGIAKVLGGLLFVSAAGAVALYFKQEMDKRPHTQHEILIVDDDIGETIKTE